MLIHLVFALGTLQPPQNSSCVDNQKRKIRGLIWNNFSSDFEVVQKKLDVKVWQWPQKHQLSNKLYA